MNIVTEKICKPSSIKDSAPTNEEVGVTPLIREAIGRPLSDARAARDFLGG
jgi:hypothetical protein